jgi:dTDP-3-amino-3,4,6-trideoxy-alpha-D-glucose transaminase
VAAFSFYPTKNLGALGDAGAVVTNDAEVAARVRSLRSYGEDDERLSRSRGLNSRLDTVQAAVLRARLPFLDEWNKRRRELARLYAAQLEDVPIELPPLEPAKRHVFHLFVVRVQGRDELRAELAAHGVETAVHYRLPIHRHPAYAHLGTDRSLPVSERLCDEVLSLPLYPQLAESEVAQVVRAAREVTRTRASMAR